jgi:hypothetical protein
MLSRLKRLNNGMVRRLKMLGRVLVFGRVTAADMSAAQAQSELNPSVAGLQAIFASLRAGCNVMDLIEVGALFRHRSSLRIIAA